MTSYSKATYSATPDDIKKEWTIIDATNLVVGRLASIIAMRLRGKHKPTYTPHMDDGDFVIVVNAEKVALTGRKWEQKTYYRHTGYPGGIKQRKAGEIRDGRYPDRIIRKAVERMLPDGPLATKQLAHLRVYAGAVHPHEAQNPKALDVASLNSKNVKAA